LMWPEGLWSTDAVCVVVVDVLCSGRACLEPAVPSLDLYPAYRRPVARRLVEYPRHRLAGEFLRVHVARPKALEHLALSGDRRRVEPRVRRLAVLARDLDVTFGRVLAGDGRDLRGQEAHDDAVLVCRPGRAVAPEQRGARALLAGEPQLAARQPGYEPLEAHGHFRHMPPSGPRDPVEQGRRNQRLAQA